MAICRFPLLNTPLHLRRYQIQFATNPAFASSYSRTHFPPLSTCCSLSPMETPPQGYRRNVGICLINPSKEIFAASRLDIPDAWQMPQGGIDEGENPQIAAMRELKEETGVSSAEVIAEVPYWLTYDFPPEVREKLRHQWGSDWKGQAQKCWEGFVYVLIVTTVCVPLLSMENVEFGGLHPRFLLKFLGDENEINLLGDGTEKAEFGQWSWMLPEQVVERAVDFKKPVYEEVLKVFAPYLE